MKSLDHLCMDNNCWIWIVAAFILLSDNCISEEIKEWFGCIDKKMLSIIALVILVYLHKDTLCDTFCC